MRVQRTRLLLALGLRRSQRVRAVLDTTVTLHQAHAVHARLASTRLLAEMVSRIVCALRVMRDTRLRPVPRRATRAVCVLRAITQVMAMAQLWRRAVISAKPMRVPRAVYLAAEATIARAPVMQAITALRTRQRLLAVKRARLASTRLLVEMVSAMRVQRTRLLLAVGLRRSLIVRAV